MTSAIDVIVIAAVLLAITSSYAPVSAPVAAAFLASAIMLIRQPELSHGRSGQ